MKPRITPHRSSFFAGQLRATMERRQGITQAEICASAKISAGQLSKYLAGAHAPRREQIEKICLAFPDEDRADLVLAWLRDLVPDCARELVRLRKADASSVREDAQETAIPLPRTLRAAFAFLMQRALEDATIPDAVLATCKVLGFEPNAGRRQPKILELPSGAYAKPRRSAAGTSKKPPIAPGAL